MGKTRPFQLPARARSILLALMRALITEPQDLVIHDRDEAYLERCEILMREFPKLTRFGFLMMLYFFDRVTLFFGFGVLRFIHLKLESQQAYVDRWIATKHTVLHEMFKSIRGMVMVAYFSHPDVSAYIGYDPQAHVKQRLELRQDVLERRLETGQLARPIVNALEDDGVKRGSAS